MRFCVAALVFTAAAFAADPFAGTWKLNAAKSTNPPGRPLPIEVTVVEQGGNLEVTSKREGDPNQQKYVYPAKGGPVTFIEGGPPANLNISEVRTRISDYVIDETVKRNGKVVSTGRYTLDKQAKVLTLRGQGTDVQGKPYEYVGVYERR